ncbi:hypothetical protein CYY_002855 [Polysphondylium violaceum]|uniref:WD40 repeat-containing protein n=1 Tax=Polysphondylium violaceum TaxID=133409 RepID=A0A8J4Q7G0_9MYCE|nr:hypothetical protein CYY_002855 [Polysphondylium violaceum]
MSLKIGVCSSIKIANTASTTYHSPASASISGGQHNQYNHQYSQNAHHAGSSQGQDGQDGNSTGITISQTNSNVNIGDQMAPVSNNIVLIGGVGSTINSSDSIGSSLSSNLSSLQYTPSASPSVGMGPSQQSYYTQSIIQSNLQANQIIFNTVCFHPKSPIMYAAIRNEIYFYDFISNSVVGKLYVDHNETIKHLAAVTTSSNTVLLLGLTEVGVAYLWDPETNKLLKIVPQIKEFDTRTITAKCIAPNKPTIYFSKLNSKDIVVVDFKTLPYKLKGHKKPISSIAHHPTKSLLASCSNDGSLKIWETRTQMSYPSSFEDFASYENSRNIEHSSNFFLAFESLTGKYMIMVGSSGLTLVYGDLSSNNPQEIIANGFICKGNTIMSVQHHPHLAVFLVLSITPAGNEEITCWEVNISNKSIVPSSLIPTFIPETNDPFSYLPKNSKPLSVPKLTATHLVLHPTKNYMTLQWEVSPTFNVSISPLAPNLNSQSFASVRHVYQQIYSINSFDSLNHSFPLVSNVPIPMGFFFQPDGTFNYPTEITFFDGTYVKCYYPLNGTTKKLIEQPVINNNADEITKPKKFLYNEELQLFALIYDSHSLTTQTQLSKYTISDIHGSFSQQGDGVDCVFMNGNSAVGHQILILGFDGKLAKVANVTKQGMSAFKNHTLTPKITSVHQTPLQDGRVVLYFSQEKACLYYSKNLKPEFKDNYAVDCSSDSPSLHLYPNERVFKVEWQSDTLKSGQNICAILTDHRIMITNAQLKIINQISVPPNHKSNNAYFHSIFWLEWTLLYTTPTHLMYTTLQNNIPPRPITTLSISPIILSTILPDRMIFGYQGQQVPGRNETSVRCQAVGLLECLIFGVLSLPPFIQFGEKKFISSCLQNVVSKFDYKRLSRSVLDKLREKSFIDLAYSLANEMHSSQSKQTLLDKFKLAWTSKQYSDANKHLSEEFARMLALKSPTDTEKRQLAKLKENMRDFGRECMNAGHYTLAKECFTKLQENVYLLQISILLNDRDSVISIRSDAESKGDIVLLAAADKYLAKRASANKVNPPVVKILPWEPTPTINLGIKVGVDYLAPINLNSITRYYPISMPFSGAAPSLNNQRHKLRAPDELWPPQDYKYSVALSPPRTLMSLVANRLSTKSHMSSTQTLRRSPSAENVLKVGKDFPIKMGANIEEYDYDDDSSDDSGADADVDSETEEDLVIVTKSLEQQILVVVENNQEIINNNQDSNQNNIDSSNSSTPSTNSITGGEQDN